MATLQATIIADFQTQLATAIAVGGTTATLQSATDDDGVALPAGRYFFTVDGANSSKEHFSCALSGTSLTSLKSVSRQGVETAGAVRAHRIGATVTITDFAHILQINNLLNGTTNLNASTPLGYDGTASITTNDQLATKAYVDGVVVSGAPDANTTTKGIVEEATQAEVDAKTQTGATGAKLFQNLSTVRSTLLSDYVIDTGAADVYVITPVPAITAYATGQIFSFKAANTNTTTSTVAVSGLAVKTIKKADGATNLAAGDIVSGQMVVVEYDGTNFQMLNPVAPVALTSASLKFGGTGADGALTISSGTTTIDCANAAFVVKNYTSISITGTGALSFSNPNSSGTTIALRSQGAVTLTSSTIPNINASGMGAAGGAGGGGNNNGTGTTGTTGTTALGIFDDSSHGGIGGGAGAIAGGGTGGAGGAILSNINFYLRTSSALARRSILIAPGTGGGGGGGGGANSNGVGSSGGTGGNGGGALIIECAGALNFTSTLGISVAGAVGTVGTTADASGAGFKTASAGGGGGGGAGGFCSLLYNTLTSSSGTINVNGGIGGAGGTAIGGNSGAGATGGAGAGGGGGGADGGAGGAGGAGASGSGSGTGGSAGVGRRCGGGGGGGADRDNQTSSGTTTGASGGASGGTENVFIAQNIWFV
jgi:hypothetical protein